jgi:DDE superfamily endonuclease
MIRLVVSLPGRVYRRPSEKHCPFNIVQRHKTCQQIMIWSTISGKGIGEIHFVNGYQNSDTYIKMMSDVLLPQIRQWFTFRNYKVRTGRRNPNENQFRYMHDYAPCHTSKKSKDFLEANSIPMLEWPANSPDINPIENCWDVLKRLVPKKFKELKAASTRSIEKASDLALLKIAISSVWTDNDLLKKTAKNAIESMPKRVELLIKARGGYIKY